MDLQAVADSLGFDLRMAIFSTINFLIVFALLRIFLFGRIGSFLRKRQAIVSESLENAEKVKTAMERAEAEKAEIIKEASNKANSIITSAQQEATETAAHIKAQAQEDAEKLEQETKQKLAAEHDEMIQSLKEETADLAIMATEKIIGEKLTDQKDADFINTYLNKLDK